jgi:hypothetical protein
MKKGDAGAQGVSYKCCNQKRKPPPADLSGDFASGGQRVVALWNPTLAFGDDFLLMGACCRTYQPGKTSCHVRSPETVMVRGFLHLYQHLWNTC